MSEEQPIKKNGEDDVVDRVGRLARLLHTRLGELGLSTEIKEAADAIPDTRDRLNYVAEMIEQAAERALNAVDVARPMQEGLEQKAAALEGKWISSFNDPENFDIEKAKALVSETRQMMTTVSDTAAETNRQLMEILMAQEFQDLTGQVLKKMIEVVKDVEDQLMQVLLDTMPEDQAKDKSGKKDEFLAGPQVGAADAGQDIMASQDQVDDLLDSMGF